MKAARAATAALESAAFDEAAGGLYRFAWNVFCDWHLELAKPVLGGDDAGAAAETRSMTHWVLSTLLALLHPIMPFVTEALWGELAAGGGLLIRARWPDPPAEWIDAKAEAELGWLIALVTEVRQLRAELNIPPSAKPVLLLAGAAATTQERLTRHRTAILRLGRLESVDLAEAPPAGSVAFVIGEATGALGIADVIDIVAERGRLAREIAGRLGDIDRAARKLANGDFLAKAPEAVIEDNRQRLAQAQAALERLRASADRLESVG